MPSSVPQVVSKRALFWLLAPAALFWILFFVPIVHWLMPAPAHAHDPGQEGLLVKWSRDVSAIVVAPLLRGLCLLSVVAGLAALVMRTPAVLVLAAASPLLFMALYLMAA